MYGNVMNRVQENVKGQPAPEVGMGVTEYCWSNRHAYTVIAVLGPKNIVVQRDKAIRTDNYGMSDVQEYRYEQDPDGVTHELVFKTTKRCPHGKWCDKGAGVKGNTFVLGHRDEHYDYSF
jgi:hypothetical protein